jgi:RNA polymerase sigma-70 factor (ECF subfamily)
MRDAGRRAAYEQQDTAPAFADPEAAAIKHDERDRVRQVLAALPSQQAQLLVLRYAGLAYKELAQALDVAPTSIGTLLARAERAFEVRYRATAGSDATGEPDALE